MASRSEMVERTIEAFQRNRGQQIRSLEVLRGYGIMDAVRDVSGQDFIPVEIEDLASNTGGGPVFDSRNTFDLITGKLLTKDQYAQTSGGKNRVGIWRAIVDLPVVALVYEADPVTNIILIRRNVVFIPPVSIRVRTGMEIPEGVVSRVDLKYHSRSGELTVTGAEQTYASSGFPVTPDGEPLRTGLREAFSNPKG